MEPENAADTAERYASVLIETALGVDRRELARRGREGKDYLARAITVLARECDSQEFAVKIALDAQKHTLQHVEKAISRLGRIDARDMTSMPGAFLVGELAELEGMLRALKIMVTAYKNA